MNWKIVTAFAAGAVIASGIVYMAVKPGTLLKPAPVAAAVVARPVAAAPVAAAQPVVVEPTPARAPAPVREKPSPMPPPARREKPAAVAQYQAPQAPALPPAEVTSPARDVAAPPPTPVAAPVAPEPPPAQAPPPVVAPTPSEDVAPPPPARIPNTVTITTGTVLSIRMGEALSSVHNQPGDTFLATLDQPLVVDGFVIAERGARVEGRVVGADQNHRSNGGAQFGIELLKLSTADGQQIRIRTDAYKKDVGGPTGRDVAKVGAITAIGAAIGAAAGGGKGAAIGAGVGGAAGVADVLLTRNKTVDIPVEARISFRLQEAVTLTERLN